MPWRATVDGSKKAMSLRDTESDTTVRFTAGATTYSAIPPSWRDPMKE